MDVAHHSSKIKVAGALQNTKGITNHSYKPYLVLNVVFQGLLL
jgi:hypothetical protein